MFDKIIIGAGIYGLYAAMFAGKAGENILVLEYEPEAFTRATYVNQARVHMGYHYPRSYSTAMKSRGYFQRFVEDYNLCIHKDFKQVYATSKNFSWTNGEEFKRFCKNCNIKCDEVSPNIYFQENTCDGAFLTEEYTYDAQLLKAHFLSEIEKLKNVKLQFSARIHRIYQDNGLYHIQMENKEIIKTPFILNATYASANQIIDKVEDAGISRYDIKYELCEIILCNTNENLKDVGITVMDGPFFSIMPFGKTGFHSLTSVTFTPHKVGKNKSPDFPCQIGYTHVCNKEQLANCNTCDIEIETAWPYMSGLARKYLKPEFDFQYKESLFSMKPILAAAEVDDSRPTVIKVHSQNPTLISVLSGKINTIYDLDEVL